MTCPHCAVPLVMSERQGVEIDYCPTCRGVWLDRGELDKILERAAADTAPPARGAPQSPPSYQNHGSHYDQGPGHHRPHKRRKSWLEEIFD
jgi:Zn-finger nucleic acid-binding protein